MIPIYATKANSIGKRIRGLIGKKNIQPIYFETHWGIHTFGLIHSIDVIIIDKHSIVRCLKQNLKPNHIFFWNPKYAGVVELPQGTIDTLGLQLGEKIKLLLK